MAENGGPEKYKGPSPTHTQEKVFFLNKKFVKRFELTPNEEEEDSDESSSAFCPVDARPFDNAALMGVGVRLRHRKSKSQRREFITRQNIS